MEQITLALDLTPQNISVLCEMLPRLSIKMAEQQMELSKGKTKKPASSKKKDLGDGNPTDAPITPEVNVDVPSETDKPETLEADTKPPTKEEVRAAALKISKAGKQAELKAIFNRYGADKLSGIAETDYPELMKDLEAVNG